jgi:uncharacterized membrane protein
MGLSSLRLRPRLVAALGAGPFQGVYSLVALLFFVPLVWTYFAHKHAGALLWSIPLGTGLRWPLYIGMGVAFVLVVAGLLQPSPAAIGSRTTEPRGVHRITRHPVFMGTGLFGLLHLAPNGFSADVAFFGGFPLFALLGCWHQDRRKLAEGGETFRSFYAQTPFLPFTGRDTLRGLRELSPLALALGIALTVALRVWHRQLFG